MAQKHKYEYSFGLDSDVAAARVVRLVERQSRVLEIGAGQGSITRHLVGSLNCSTVALDVDPGAIAKLKALGCNAYKVDFNMSDWVEKIATNEGKFDSVIAADVLEHLYNPWAVLGAMKSLLNDRGSIILSLPHVGHASVAACLFDEDFDYQENGLLDKTHIRFFGIKNIERLHRSQGLEIERAEFVVRTPEMTEFARRWKRLPETTRSELLKNKFSTVYQVVTRAVPQERLATGISLFEVEVKQPEDSIVAYWSERMAKRRSPSDEDNRSTLCDIGSHEKSKTFESSVTAFDNVQTSLGSYESATAKTTLIAYFLTQFHPIPENDAWWGKGFTEWTNVTKALPVFNRHYQPHLPSELGFYDLRVRETRHAQIELAKKYGIGGFCYYYYWFSGKKLLEAPLEDMLADKDSNMPFMLMWANENWTRRWDASENEILIEQLYRDTDPLDFIRSVAPYLRDERYIRFDGKPVLAVYRPQHLPEARRWLDVWRDYCRAEGIGDLYLCCAYTHGNWDHEIYGFDSGLEFPPHNLVDMKTRALGRQLHFFRPEFCDVVDFAEAAERYLSREYSPLKRAFRTVFTSWDNTPRRKQGGTVILNGTPENYEWWLAQAIDKSRKDLRGRDNLVFINAWNEWAEGAHLEPDHRYGRAFLEATARALEGTALSGWSHRGLNRDSYVVEKTKIFHRGPNQPPLLTGD